MDTKKTMIVNWELDGGIMKSHKVELFYTSELGAGMNGLINPEDFAEVGASAILDVVKDTISQMIAVEGITFDNLQSIEFK